MCGRSGASYPPGGAGFPCPKQKQFLVSAREVDGREGHEKEASEGRGQRGDRDVVLVLVVMVLTMATVMVFVLVVVMVLCADPGDSDGYALTCDARACPGAVHDDGDADGDEESGDGDYGKAGTGFEEKTKAVVVEIVLDLAHGPCRIPGFLIPGSGF